MDLLKEFGWGNIIAIMGMFIGFVVMFTKYRTRMDGLVLSLKEVKDTVTKLASIKELEKVEKSLEEVCKKLEHIELHGCVRVTADMTAVHREIEDHDRRIAKLENAIVQIAVMSETLIWIKQKLEVH